MKIHVQERGLVRMSLGLRFLGITGVLSGSCSELPIFYASSGSFVTTSVPKWCFFG